jgi:DNA-binding transcriptional ArsR family regulator
MRKIVQAGVRVGPYRLRGTIVRSRSATRRRRASVATEAVGARCALSRLVGPRRARILEALSAPKTTGETAAAVGIAPSTASEHLHELNLARVVVRARRGKRVYYVLSPIGRRLVEELGAPSQRAHAAAAFNAR